MAVPAETLVTQQEVEEVINRRTDDVIFNVRYLARHIIDKELGIFEPEAERDVLEQDVTDIAEADVHKLGAKVEQQLDLNLGEYMSLGGGTVQNARKGCEALDMTDPDSQFEFFRRAEEIVEETSILQPEVQQPMRSGETKVFVSPAPTHHEADPDVAASFGYDDRTMFRMQTLSPDGMTKTMQSFSLFNVPAKSWAAFLGDRYGAQIEPTGLAVMQFCNQVLLEKGTSSDVLREFIGGVVAYVDEDDQASVERQLDSFLNEQVELQRQTTYYANEQLALQKELALSLNGWARPTIRRMIENTFENLNPKDRALLAERFYGDKLYVDDYVAKLAIRMKTLTVDNRAGLATLNEHTVKRVASRIGLEATLELARREQAIQQAEPGMENFMVSRSEQQIAESGVGCGGACSVSVVDLFSADAKSATEAGLSGTLYSAESLNKGSKCSCVKKGKNAKVISDGSNVVCVSCGDFQSKGKKGNIKTGALRSH